MNKKGADFAITVLIGLVVAFVVAIIVILIVKQKVTEGSEKYSEIGDQATLAEDKCSNLLQGTFCALRCDENKGHTQKPGTWLDCEEKSKKESKKSGNSVIYVCCEKT